MPTPTAQSEAREQFQIPNQLGQYRRNQFEATQNEQKQPEIVGTSLARGNPCLQEKDATFDPRRYLLYSLVRNHAVILEPYVFPQSMRLEALADFCIPLRSAGFVKRGQRKHEKMWESHGCIPQEIQGNGL